MVITLDLIYWRSGNNSFYRSKAIYSGYGFAVSEETTNSALPFSTFHTYV